MDDITGPLLQPLGMGALETVAKGTEYWEGWGDQGENGGVDKIVGGKKKFKEVEDSQNNTESNLGLLESEEFKDKVRWSGKKKKKKKEKEKKSISKTNQLLLSSRPIQQMGHLIS